MIKSAAALLLLVSVSVAGLLLAWNAGLLRSSFIQVVSWQSGRHIEVRGALRLHLLTRSPRIEAEQVTIGNPPWTKPGITAEVAKLTLTFAPLLSHQSGLSLLKTEYAQLHLIRDSAGHANWQSVDPDKSPGGPLPMIRVLEMAHTHLTLVDERRHLVFDGDLSLAGPDSARPFQMEGSGTLNQRAVTFRLTGDALASASTEKPYAFAFDERSSGTHVTARGTLPRPFDLHMVDAEFDANGDDLRDMYYLVGIRLPNTGVFRLRGRMMRRGPKTIFDELSAVSGQSDVEGRVSLERKEGDRTLVHANLISTVLRLADVGLRAAGRDPHPDAPRKVFSDVRLIFPAIRRIDATGKYSIRRLELSRIELTDVTAPFTIEHGLISAPEVTGHILGGSLVLHLETDANQTPSRSRVTMNLTSLQLAQMPHKAEPPPYEGSLMLQIHAQGAGNSLHALAADASGTLSAQVSEGTMRASLAEMAAVDLRGLGLTLTRSSRDVAVHCAGADFKIDSGVMSATRLFIDSEPVFIGGEGRVLLDPETLDLKLHGEPKRMRILRVKAPVLVQGTLLQPTFKVGSDDSHLQLVDRGAAHDADCASLQPH